MGRMRVRIALGLAFLATAIGLAIDMSGSAPRIGGDNKVSWPPPSFTDIVPGGGRICIGETALPADTGRIEMTIGTFGRRLPPIAVAFEDGSGKVVARGMLKGGGEQGPQAVSSLPLSHRRGASVLGKLCLHVGGHRKLAFGGAPFALAAAFTTINGAPQTGRPAVIFFRPGSESWWSLLGALDERFGLGKSPIFGDWTLPLVALAILALWFSLGRLLWRELR
jgi:hypothetical protein